MNSAKPVTLNKPRPGRTSSFSGSSEVGRIDPRRNLTEERQCRLRCVSSHIQIECTLGDRALMPVIRQNLLGELSYIPRHCYSPRSISATARAEAHAGRRGLLWLQGRHCLFRCGAET